MIPTVHHPWMERATWEIARTDDCSAGGLGSLLNLDKNWLIWIDLELDEQKQFHWVCPKSNLFDLKKSDTHGPSLSEIIPQVAGRDVIFNVRALDTQSADAIVDALGKRTNDIGIASPSQNFLKELRKKRPLWLYASDFSTWGKLKLYSMLGIETAVDLWPDFFVGSFASGGMNQITERAAKEIFRRKKILILESDDVAVPREIKPYLRGILTTRPKSFSHDTFFGEMGAK
jgi:hypothetical protein